MKCLVRMMLVLFMLTGAALAGDFGTSVGTTSIVILGAPGQGAAAFVTGAVYAAGSRVTSGNGTFYNPSAGTAGVTNSLYGPADMTDGSVIWRPVLSRPREGLIVANAGAGTVYLFLGGSPAATNKGIFLIQNGSLALTGMDCPQGNVSAISATGNTNDVRSVEW